MQVFDTWNAAITWVDECDCGGRWQIGNMMLFSQCTCGQRRAYTCKFTNCCCLNHEIRGKQKGIDVFGRVA